MRLKESIPEANTSLKVKLRSKISERVGGEFMRACEA